MTRLLSWSGKLSESPRPKIRTLPHQQLPNLPQPENAATSNGLCRIAQQRSEAGCTTVILRGRLMKAILFHEYGSPDVLRLEEIEKPVPKDNQVLIKVHAASANPLDWHRMRGAPFIVRMDEGWRKSKNPRLGADIAGRVEAVGSSVTQFKPGDEVFGETGSGAFAEYKCVREDKLVLKPANISFEEAAAVPVAAITALQGLRDTGQIQSGQRVLINGASGGVGTYAVQIAKAFGAEVTGVCSTRNLDMVRSIGADHVVDYTREDFTRTEQKYDLIYCAMGNRSTAAYQRALRPNGICSIAGFTTMFHMILQVMILGSLATRFGTQKIVMMGLAQPNKKDMEFLKELLETRKIVSVIDQCYPLSATAEAMRHLETGHARGKVIVTMDQPA
jgi:NADPH:quinone reductase-like Zn-dependent oxidoreductase